MGRTFIILSIPVLTIQRLKDRGLKMPSKFGTVWFLLLTILVVFLLTGKKHRLSAAWKGLTGELTL